MKSKEFFFLISKSKFHAALLSTMNFTPKTVLSNLISYKFKLPYHFASSSPRCPVHPKQRTVHASSWNRRSQRPVVCSSTGSARYRHCAWTGSLTWLVTADALKQWNQLKIRTKLKQKHERNKKWTSSFAIVCWNGNDIFARYLNIPTVSEKIRENRNESHKEKIALLDRWICGVFFLLKLKIYILLSLHYAASIMILMRGNFLTSDCSDAKRGRHAFQREFSEKVWQWSMFSDACELRAHIHTDSNHGIWNYTGFADFVCICTISVLDFVKIHLYFMKWT